MVRKNKIKKMNRDATRLYNISYHIVWIPKYRKRILTKEIEIKLKEILFEKAKQLGINICAIESMPDHIHIFFKSNPNLNVSYIVKNLKGYSSKKLREQFPCLNKMKCLWAPSYYCETIGHISEETIIKYIENQKNNP